MTPKTALYQLKNTPQMFLQNNMLTIHSAGNLSGPMQLFIGGKEMRASGGMNEAFNIARDKGIAGVGAIAIPSYSQYVRMIPSSEDLEIWDIPPYDLNANAGDLMVTSQLSACAFAVLQQGAQLLVAHVQPGNARGDRNVVASRLQIQGRFRGLPNARLTAVYGANRYSNRCNIVGVRRGGHWELYAQNFDGSMLNPTISAVTRFF